MYGATGGRGISPPLYPIETNCGDAVRRAGRRDDSAAGRHDGGAAGRHDDEEAARSRRSPADKPIPAGRSERVS